MNESALTQVVILDAGMDMRAFRLEWSSTVTIFEIDRADVFDRKEMVLDRLQARAASRRRTIPADLRRSWSPGLLKTGFDPEQKTAFFIKRTVFWDAAVVARLLDEIDTIASPGSWIGLASIIEDTRLSPFMTPFLDKWESLGLPPWTFAVNDPDSWLGTHGWQTTSVVVGSPEASYGRWPYAYISRGTPAIPRAFLTQGWMGGKEDVWRGSR